MNVSKLFYKLTFIADIEIVIAFLPKMLSFPDVLNGPASHTSGPGLLGQFASYGVISKAVPPPYLPNWLVTPKRWPLPSKITP
jgi:hypothetical protein